MPRIQPISLRREGGLAILSIELNCVSGVISLREIQTNASCPKDEHTYWRCRRRIDRTYLSNDVLPATLKGA